MTRLIGNDMAGEEVLEGDFDDISALQDDVDGQIAAVIGEFGDEEVNSTKLKVYRVVQNMGKMEWLFDCTVSELPIMQRLRDEYGGGSYEARLYAKTESDKWAKLKKKFEFLIGEPKKQVINPNGNKEMVSVMVEGFNKLGELIAIQRQSSQPDMMAMQTNMMQNMLQMRELLGLGGQQKQPDPMEQMTKFLEMQSAFSSIRDDRETNTNDLLLSLANHVLPQLAEMGKKEQELQAASLLDKKSNPVNTNNAQRTPATEKTEENKAMKMQLVFLTGMAKKDADPMVYAQMILDQTPPEKISDLLSFVSSPGALEKMTEIHEPIKNYSLWFTELGECVRVLYNEAMEMAKESDALTAAGSSTKVETPGNETQKTKETATDAHAAADNGAFDGDT